MTIPVTRRDDQTVLLPRCENEERAVLGAILEGNADAYDISSQQGIEPSDFFLSSHRLIYSVVTDMAEAGEAIDLLSVSGKLRDRGQLVQIGGEAYLAKLLDGTVYGRRSFVGYVKRVRNTADLRRLIAGCQATICHASENGARASECIDLLNENVLPIQAGSTETPTLPITAEKDYSDWCQLSETGQGVL